MMAGQARYRFRHQRKKSHMIRVLVVDNHEHVRTGLAVFLASFDDIQPIGQAASGRDAIAQAAKLKPEVILMDIDLPEIDGIKATEQIIKEQPDIQIVLMSSFQSKETILRALEAGAARYLQKDTATDEIATVIREVYNLG